MYSTMRSYSATRARLVSGWTNVLRSPRTGLGCAAIFSLNRIVDFLAVNRNRLGRFNAETYFVSAYVHYGHHHVITNHDAFVTVSR